MLGKLLSHKHPFWITTTLLVLLPIIVIVAVWFRHHSTNNGETRYRVWEPVSVRDEVQVFGHSREFLLMSNNPNVHFTNRYAYTVEQKVLIEKNGENLTDDQVIPKSDYWKIYLYNLDEDGLPVKELDLNKIVETYHPGYYPIAWAVGEYRKSPKNILTIKIKNKDDIQVVTYNLETNKMEGEYVERSDVYEEIDILFSYTSLSDYVESKGYLVLDYISNYSNVNHTTLDENINLFSEYPEVREKIVEDDWVLIPRNKYVNNEDWFNTVLHWMAPVGEDKLTIYGMDKNGRITDSQIATYADYQAWVQERQSERKQDEKNRSR